MLRGEDFLRALVEHTSEGILGYDAETKRVVFSNPALQKMLLYTRADLQQMTIYDFSAHGREDVDSRVRAILKAGDHFLGERRYRCKDGSLIDVEVHSSVLSYYGSKVVCALVRNVTERKRVEAERERLYREKSDITRTLQRALLPPRLPEVPGAEVAACYVAAGEGTDVGGDFYDLFSVPGNGWVAVMGDVSGKGAEAAVLTSLAHYTLRATAMHAGGPSQVLSVLNEEILRQTNGERFFSVAYGNLHPTERGARFITVRCGHPPPLLLRASGHVEELGEPGMVLGVIPDPKMTESSVNLAPGDAVVLYTDGVTEARSPDGAFFGEEGLVALLKPCAGKSAEEVAGKIEREVVAFQANVASDDIAVLVLRVTGGSAVGDNT